MVFGIYSVFDRLDNCHSGLVLQRTDARASRSFCEQIRATNVQAKANNRPLTDINDYELHKLGTFDDVTGVITPLPHYEVLPLSWSDD